MLQQLDIDRCCRFLRQAETTVSRSPTCQPWRVGALGHAHTYKDILAAARALATSSDANWMFVFVCWGATRPALQEESKNLGNVAVLDYVPPEQLSDLLWSADVHLITMAE